MSQLNLFSLMLLAYLTLAPRVRGNTEIINFEASLAESPNLAFADWTKLSPYTREISTHITPLLDLAELSPDSGLWFTLDLDHPDWTSYHKFTLRASWPASHPCDVYLKISEPLQVANQLERNRALHSTRTKYAHVYAVNTGVPTPSSSGEDMTWLRKEPIPITLVLEPLLLGVVPQSVVPVIFAVLASVGVGVLLLPFILPYYDNAIKLGMQDIPKSKRE